MNHWEDLIIDLINSNGLCYDGQNFFDTDHLWGDSGTQKNEITATEVPALDVTTATAPTPSEMAAAILGCTGHMLTFKDDKGRYVNGKARMFTVAVSTVPLMSSAVQAITANLLTGVVDNPLTGMKQAGFSYTVKMIPALTSATTKMRLFRTDGPVPAVPAPGGTGHPVRPARARLGLLLREQGDQARRRGQPRRRLRAVGKRPVRHVLVIAPSVVCSLLPPAAGEDRRQGLPLNNPPHRRSFQWPTSPRPSIN
jgi:hypothetical protein